MPIQHALQDISQTIAPVTQKRPFFQAQSMHPQTLEVINGIIIICHLLVKIHSSLTELKAFLRY